MKKILLGILILAVVISLSGASLALAVPTEGKARERDKNIEKIEFIHYKKDFARPEWAKAAKAPTCYKFLTPSKIKWGVLPVSYVINPTNSQGLLEEFITGAVSTSAETWDAATNTELMNDTFLVDYNATYGVRDYKNAVVFGDYPTEGVIAVTAVWYNTLTRRIVEFDIMMDTDFQWGDATVDSTKMDLQNIATHELGHGVGLGDIYTSACSAVTMYGYSDEGETTKRTLEAPDITGLQTLYGY